MDSVGLDVLDDHIVVRVRFGSVDVEISSLLHGLHVADNPNFMDRVSSRLFRNREIRRLKNDQPRLPHIPA